MCGIDVGGCLVEETLGEVAAGVHAIEVAVGEELVDVSASLLPSSHR